MIELDFDLTYFRQSHRIHEIDDFLEGRFHNRLARADHAKAKDRALPEVLVPAFRNRDVETVRDLRLNSLEHSSFAFQGVILGEPKVEL